MKYIKEFFDDKHNFWNSGTLTCIIILSMICIIDCISTLQILSTRGGIETNMLMRPFTYSPLLLLIVKLVGVNVFILHLQYQLE